MATAVYPVAAGHPIYSGNYIPTRWSPKIQQRFYKKTIFMDIANTDYEGEIKKDGDQVTIRKYPVINVSRYYKGQELDTQLPDTTPTTLKIDKGYYFNFLLDDVDKVQSDIPLMNAYSEAAARDLQIGIDADVLQNVYSSAGTGNYGTTAGADSSSINLGGSGARRLQFTKTNIIDHIVDAAIVMDEQSVPDDNRWIVFPPHIAGLIDSSDLKDASLTGDKESPIRSHRIGTVSNITVHISRQLYSVTDTSLCYACIFGHPIAISFAAQLTENESIRSEKTFGTKIRGLEVYGYGVTKSEALGYLYGYR